MGNKLIPLPENLLGWRVIEDMGMVEIQSINNVSGNRQRKRQVKLECPTCKDFRVFYLGNIKQNLNKKLRCISEICKKGDLSHRYQGMINRCYNPLVKSYKTHGALGVKVCPDWVDNPISFVIWAKNNGFKKELFLDRVYNDRDYSPDNCRWVTPSDSALNRKVFRNNSTGYKGITKYKNPRSSKHRFKVTIGSKQRGVLKKYADTLEEAIIIRENFIKELGLEKYYT